MKQELRIALYSIKPIYSNKIISGHKTYELRKRVPAKYIDYILIYSSSPISKVVAYAEVKKVHKNTASEIWKNTSKYTCITKRAYDEYFKGCDMAYAIELGVIKKFTRPFAIKDINSGYVAPQSFSYVNQDEFKKIIRRKTEAVLPILK